MFIEATIAPEKDFKKPRGRQGTLCTNSFEFRANVVFAELCGTAVLRVDGFPYRVSNSRRHCIEGAVDNSRESVGCESDRHRGHGGSDFLNQLLYGQRAFFLVGVGKGEVSG